MALDIEAIEKRLQLFLTEYPESTGGFVPDIRALLEEVKVLTTVNERLTDMSVEWDAERDRLTARAEKAESELQRLLDADLPDAEEN